MTTSSSSSLGSGRLLLRYFLFICTNIIKRHVILLLPQLGGPDHGLCLDPGVEGGDALQDAMGLIITFPSLPTFLLGNFLQQALIIFCHHIAHTNCLSYHQTVFLFYILYYSLLKTVIHCVFVTMFNCPVLENLKMSFGPSK